jgi:predicted component of type VI protein secretion system
LWGNPAYFVGAQLLGGFAQHFCYASNSASRYSGIVSRLPSISLRQGTQVLKSSLEQEFPHDVVGELEALGFIVLHRLGNSERVMYTPLRALAATGEFGKALQSAGMPYLPPLMLGARLMSALKSLIRDLRGIGLEPEWLHAMETWICIETCFSLDPDLGQKIRFPLRAATVSASLHSYVGFESHPSLRIGLTLTTHSIPNEHGKSITVELAGSVLVDMSASWNPLLPWGEGPNHAWSLP